MFTVKIGNTITKFVSQYDGSNWRAVFPNGNYFSCDAMPTTVEIQARIDAQIARRGIEKVRKSFLAHRFGGYTPVALTNLLHMHSKSREDCAAILGVSENSVGRWCADIGSKRRADMALELWERLNVYLIEYQETALCEYVIYLAEPITTNWLGKQKEISKFRVQGRSIASAKEAAYQEFGNEIKIAHVAIHESQVTS